MMDKICVLKNPVQEYAWGSFSAIPELLGKKYPADAPQAELWMGAHPKAPSLVEYSGRQVSLVKLIEKYPREILGKEVAVRYHNKLPYLFKVLAAAKPLSLQAHPSLAQAREGFRKENELGIPIDAPTRNYRDDNHKPECICALTPFWALNGFRKIPEMISLFEMVFPDGLHSQLKHLKENQNPRGLKQFFHALLSLAPGVQKQVTDESIVKINRLSEQRSVFKWMLAVSKEYPADVGIFSPIILNLICLQPGEAMFLPAGELHAYLDGMGIELMANSDNVLRGGLTPKHVDVQKLLDVLNFSRRQIEILTPQRKSDAEKVYPSQADEFVLSVVTPAAGIIYDSPTERSVELMICTQGKAAIRNLATEEIVALSRGASVLVPAAVKRYRIQGSATLYKAAVPT